MLKTQDELIRITAELLIESDRIHRLTEAEEVTEFEVDEFVLVAQRSQLETRMHTQWRGPMRVVAVNHAEYTLLNLVTNKEVIYHMTQL